MARRRQDTALCPDRSWIRTADAERRWLRAFRLLLSPDEQEQGARQEEGNHGQDRRSVCAGLDGAAGGEPDHCAATHGAARLRRRARVDAHRRAGVPRRGLERRAPRPPGAGYPPGATARRGQPALVDTLLIASPNRLVRRYAYQVWLLEAFARAGCAVVFLDRPPRDDPQDALLVQIRGVVAEYERAVIADRTRRGRLAALQAGRLVPWSRPPYGYRADPRAPRDPAGVTVDTTQAAVVRPIFAWYVEDGLTFHASARRLTAAGTPTARGHARWGPPRVGGILSNSAYQGTAFGNRQERVPSRRRFPLSGARHAGGRSTRTRPSDGGIAVPIPAIVTPAVFAAAQARLARKRAWSPRTTQGA